ncbi:MAG: sugar ABC transporter substrate-binding protein [Bacillota bacterium]
MRKNMVISALAVLVLSLAFFTGSVTAGDSTLFAGTTIKIIAETQNPTLALEKLLPEFEKLTGIKVQLTHGPIDSVVQKELLALQSGTGEFDVISAPYQFLGSFAENGYVLPLEPLMNDPKLSVIPGFDKNDIIKGMWDASGLWKGTYYGIPSNTCIMMFFYRKDLFENREERADFKKKYGYDLQVPQTWKQHRDVAEFFTRKRGQILAGQRLTHDFYGTTIAAKRHDAMTCEWLNYAWSFGGGIFDAKGNLIINDPKNVAALEYFVELKKFSPPGVTNNTWDEVTTQFQQGIVAMAVHWNDCAPSLEDPTASKVCGKMGYGAIPVGESPAAHFGAWTYFIPKTSKNPQAAWLFLQWANTRAVQKRLPLTGGFPCLKSVYGDPELVQKLPYWEASLEAYKISSTRPRIPEWNEMNNEMMLELSRAISGEQTPKQALDALQEKYQRLLKGQVPLSYQ